MKKIFILGIILLTSISVFSQGYLKRSEKKILDKEGNEIILRGMGLGGWLLQEGYMLKTSSFAGTQHEIEAHIEDMIGKEKKEEFYERWYENHFTRKDAEQMAEWGFNSVRLPMHYKLYTLPIEDEPVAGQNTWLDKGFIITDSLLDWCADNEMYLILDLHAAPGGQGQDANISDYDDTKPSLWESEANRAKTVALWRKLAERYANEEWIGGYDLINEPNWDLPGNTLLKELYVDITEAIREVDTNHIIFIEGNWFATDFNGLTPPWDDNMVYSFHRYWNTNDIGTINYLIQIRNTHNVPLWMGESGENSNQWFKEAITLLESNDIGWAWWPLKKIDNIVGPYSAPMTPGYQRLLDYWSGNASRPTADYAYAALIGQVNNLKTENCTFQPGVIDALFRQQTTNETIPYKQHSIPGRIYAVDYDLGPEGFAYRDGEYQNTGGPGAQQWNNGGNYRNDGVDIEICEDGTTNGFNVGWTETGEMLRYTVNVSETGNYDLNIRYSANDSQGKILLFFNSVNFGSYIDLPSTGGWQNWQTLTVENIPLNAGETDVQIRLYFGGFNLNYFQFLPSSVNVEDNDEKTGFIDNYRLDQNYPNPFNNGTVIKFTLKEPGNVKLSVFDTTGQIITELVNDFKTSGNHSVKWNTENLSSGVYFYSLETESGFSSVKKAIHLK